MIVLTKISYFVRNEVEIGVLIDEIVDCILYEMPVEECER